MNVGKGKCFFDCLADNSIHIRLTMSSSPVPLAFSTNSSSSTPIRQALHACSLQLPAPFNTPSHVRWTKDEHPRPKTVRYRLSQLCREGQPHLARQLFDEIPSPTTVVWNAIIIGFICNSMPHEAILLYSQMKSNSFLSDSYTYSSILKACAQTQSLRIGKAVHCHIIRSHLYPSKIVCNSLLNMYASCLYDDVKSVFESIPKRNVISWNILISWYVKMGLFVEAVTHFVKLLKSGLKPTVVSFVNVFPAVAGIGDSKLADAVYGLLTKSGDEYFTDVFATSSAISMFAELGSLESARKIFDYSLERNIEIWNTMISGYVLQSLPDEALNLFIHVLHASDDVAIDDVTLISVLTAVSQLQELDLANQIHAYIIKTMPISPVMVMNTLVVMYSRCNSIEESSKIFKYMNEKDTVSWNTMISSFVQNGMDDEGLKLVYEMQNQGFVIDDVTISAVLSAASNLRNREIGKQTHGYLVRHNIEFEGMESYLIDMYAKSGLIKVAQNLFERTSSSSSSSSSSSCDRDQATWNTMISGNSQNGLIEQAFDVFKQMIDHNVSPNSVTLASILPSCSVMGIPRLAKEIHSFSIRHSLDNNVFVHSALVDTYSKLGIITYAENVFLLSHEKNLVTYTNMILGYGQHGMGEKSLHVFNSMKENGIKPDSVTIVAVLCACSYSGLVDEGLQLFESMEEEYEIVPSVEHYCCVVDMLGRVGRVLEAYDFVKGLGEKGNDLKIWGSLMGCCRIHGEFELGKVVGEKLVEMGVGDKNSGYHVLLSNMFAEEGNWECVDRLRREMFEKAMVKEPAYSWIDNGGRTDYFMSRDRNLAHGDEIYEMLDVLDTDMKDVEV
ncbi:pentatricopeptide repeat-containing protein At3g22150, chloroplastic [Lactuca sativa]|nr:pentatricopeptide repeat-containing protein At3g22150, chloroplastic [Lactuca sativa]